MIQIAIIVIVLGIGYGVAFFILGELLNSIRTFFQNYHSKKEIEKTIDFYNDRRSKMRKDGDMHEWASIVVPTGIGETEKRTVCKKTGWCPEIKDFYTDNFVKEALKKQEIEEHYTAFRDLEIGAIAIKYNISKDSMAELVEDVFNIKKQFHLNHISEQIKDMKKR